MDMCRKSSRPDLFVSIISSPLIVGETRGKKRQPVVTQNKMLTLYKKFTGPFFRLSTVSFLLGMCTKRDIPKSFVKTNKLKGVPV